MKSPIFYFGYGANKDPDMIAAIIGRKPEGEPAILEGWELCIQEWTDIPEKPREILVRAGWDEKFRSYSIRRAEREQVAGTLWELTQEEREGVADWELIEFGWYERAEVAVQTREGQTARAQTEVVDKPGIEKAADGINYETFLNRREDMLRVAESARRQYLERIAPVPAEQRA